MTPFDLLPHNFRKESSLVENMTLHHDLSYYERFYIEKQSAPFAIDAIQHYKNIETRNEPYIRLMPRGTSCTHSAIHYTIYRMISASNNPYIMFGTPTTQIGHQTQRLFEHNLEYAIDQYNAKVLSAFDEKLTIERKANTVHVVSTQGTKLSSVTFFSCTSPAVIRGRTSSEFVLDSVLTSSTYMSSDAIMNFNDIITYPPMTGHRLTIFQGGLIPLKTLFDYDEKVKYTGIDEFSHINPMGYQWRMLNSLGITQYTLECLCSREVLDNERRI